MAMAHSGITSGSNEFTLNSASIEAMKCLVNCIHGTEDCRAIFVESKGILLTMEFLQNESLTLDAKFLALRFLFLLSAHSVAYAAEMRTLENFGSILHSLFLSYASHLLEHKQISVGMGNELTILSEISKIVFNVTMVHEVEGTGLGGLLGGIAKTKEDKSAERVEDEKKKTESVKGFEDQLPAQLCKILSLSLSLAMPYQHTSTPLEALSHPPTDPTKPDYSKKRADEIIPPLILVLKELANAHPKLRESLRSLLTPDDIDRSQKLDATDTTVARLIHLMSSISLENCKNSVGEMLFALFDEDASKLTSYIGYGNAAGFLFQRGIMSNPNGGDGPTQRPTSSSSDMTANDDESHEIYDGPSTSSKKGKAKVSQKLNPITGEIMKDEKQVNEEWERLSDAEKEYETHKLMEMFEKLNKSGFIKAVRKEDMDGQTGGGGGAQ
ncbi:hypothetical protein HDU98_006831 [Podochytrium sp. JEL0797]|nr:hypothetical protein HDU98_006831 [Podochytrium sp. JEL0797]